MAGRGLRLGPGTQALLVLALFAFVLLWLAILRQTSPDQRDELGRTKLQVAAGVKAHDTMRELLADGADPDASGARKFVALRRELGLPRQTVYPFSPLEICAWNCDPVGTTLLLDAGATRQGQAARTVVESNCAPVLRLLLEARGHPPLAPGDGPALLHLAIRDVRPQLAELLLDAGADPNAVPPFNQTRSLPLALSHCSPISRAIAQRGLGDYRPDRYREPLDPTAEELEALVQVLLDGGALPDGADASWTLTPLDWAERVCESEELVAILEAGGASARGGSDAAVRAALLTGSRTRLKAALADGGSPDQVLPDGRTLLSWATDNPPLADLLRDALRRRAWEAAAAEASAP